MKGWILLTLGIALFGAVRSALRKYLTDDYGTLELSFTTNAYETVFLLPAALWEAVHVMDIEAVSPTVVGVATLSGLFGALTSIAGYRAFALEDLSVAKPLIKLNPIIIAFVEPLLLAETFDHAVLTGAILAGLGGYVILLRDHGVLDPICRFTEPGLQFALLAAVAAAGSVLTTRYAAQRLPQYAFAAYWAGVIVVAVVAPMLYYESCPGWRSFCDRCVIATGVLGAIRGVLFVVVLKLASAARISIVLQTGILFSVLLGGWVFRERHLWKRLVGAMLLVGGVAIVIYV